MNTWTIVFDLDGTLVDTAPDLAASANHVMNHLGLRPVAEGDIRPFVGHGALAMVERAAAANYWLSAAGTPNSKGHGRRAFRCEINAPLHLTFKLAL